MKLQPENFVVKFHKFVSNTEAKNHRVKDTKLLQTSVGSVTVSANEKHSREGIVFKDDLQTNKEQTHFVLHQELFCV
jgi:hypothetical protein